MQTFSTTSQPWQEVLDRLPPDLDLDALAFSSGALKRRREVGDGTTLLLCRVEDRRGFSRWLQHPVLKGGCCGG